MKRLFIGAAVSVMTILSACEAPLVQENESSGNGLDAENVEKTKIFTATLGSDTKLYLDYDAEQNVYKALWNEDDYIFVCNPATQEYEKCYLTEGAGTSTAKFAGSIEAEEYVAVYAYDVYNLREETLYIYMSPYQEYALFKDPETGLFRPYFLDRSFPMIAKSSSKNFSFQNLTSVLKLSVTGQGEEMRLIKITPNDENTFVGGNSIVDFSGDSFELTVDELRDLTYNVWGTLSDTPMEYYITLPAQTYRGGFKIELETEETVMEVNITQDVEMRRSRIRNLNIGYTLTGWTEPEEEWEIWLSTQNTAYEIPMTFENGFMVARDVELGPESYFRFLNKTWSAFYSWFDSYYDYFINLPTNTAVPVYDYDTASMSIWPQGLYDVYLATDGLRCFVMEAGKTPYDIPTQSVVLGWMYWNLLYGGLPEGEVRKVQGHVVAKTQYGIVLALDSKPENAIFVFDQNDILVDIEIGDYMDLYAVTSVYRGLAELVYSVDTRCWHSVCGSYVGDFIETAYDITEQFDSYSSDEYQYISFSGSLETRGVYYNISVEGADTKGSISAPLQNLNDYIGSYVTVEGYYLGHEVDSNGNSYLNIALTNVSKTWTESSTNDVLPGADITVIM